MAKALESSKLVISTVKNIISPYPLTFEFHLIILVTRNLNEEFIQEQNETLRRQQHVASMQHRHLGGRPLGTTKIKKNKDTNNEIMAKHHIVCKFKLEVENGGFKALTKKELFSTIYQNIVLQYKLPASFSFPYKTAMSRINRNSYLANGNISPLHSIEQNIVDLLLCMSKVKRALTASESLRLINELIDGTNVQKDLISWKIKKKIYTKNESDLGKVGLSYWRSFLKRQGHQVRSKVAKKYAIDRSNWTSYLNFKDMYLHIKDVLLNDSKIAIKLDDPIWVDKSGNKVDDEAMAFGCKTDIKIVRPDMAIMFDEVGCNLSQEGDNVNGGEKFICGPSDVPYQSSATKNTHFTTLAVTRFDGEPLMCVTIISGKKGTFLQRLASTGVNYLT